MDAASTIVSATVDVAIASPVLSSYTFLRFAVCSERVDWTRFILRLHVLCQANGSVHVLQRLWRNAADYGLTCCFFDSLPLTTVNLIADRAFFVYSFLSETKILSISRLCFFLSSIVCASMIPIFLFNYRFCDYFRIFAPFTVSNAPLRVGRQKYSCVFLAMSAKRKLTKEKKKKEGKRKKKTLFFFSPFFLCFVPVQRDSRKACRSSSPCVYDMAFMSFFFSSPDSIRILFLLRRFRSCPVFRKRLFGPLGPFLGAQL